MGVCGEHQNTGEGATSATGSNASDTKIQRHVKIRGEANPFDPKQEAYFEDRLGLKMRDSLAGQVKWYRLWWSQDKECPI